MIARCSRPAWSPSALLLPTAVALQTRWRVVDQSGTVWIHDWLDEAFTSIEPDAVVVSWWSYSTPLWYGQLVEHRRPDISIIDDRTRLDEHLGSITDVIEANLDTRPVYLIRGSPAEIEALRSRYVIEQVGSARQPVPGHRPPGGSRMTVAPAPASTGQVAPDRVPRLSYFFPAHNEEANLEGLVAEALEALPAIADQFEIIAVDDGSKDRTAEIADRLAAEHPDVVRVVHHPVNRGYGGALRSGFEASRYELLAFTDGDRQFRVADLGRLTARLAEADRPDVVVGYRIKRADPVIRVVYARTLQARQPDLLRPQGQGRRLRVQAVPPRGARGRAGRVRRRVLLGRAADQGPGRRAVRRAGRRSRTTRGRPARRPARSRP